jgi:hypothetical protein
VDCVVTFMVQGYYSETMRLDDQDLRTGTSADGDTLIARKDLRIVLEEIGPATPMVKYGPDCQFRAAGEWEVNQLVTDRDGARELLRPPLWHKPDMTGKGIEALPPYCPYVRADVRDGVIVLAEKPVVRSSAGVEAWLPEQTPARVYLGISGPGNGLALFDPGPDRKRDADIEMRAMKEAPETGYTQEILLDQSTHQYACFYLKIGDWYGKGYVRLLVQRHDPTYLSRPSLQLWIQPDGSRNVRSLR